MAYVKQTWVNGVTPIDAAHLNHIEEGIENSLQSDELEGAVSNALAQAKASGEFDGADGKDGKDGVNGQDGYTPVKGVDYFDGKDGAAGKDGEDGYTPVKGTDYFTEADKAEMVEDVKNSIDGLDELLGSGVEEATYIPNLYGYMSVAAGELVNTTSTDVYHTDHLELVGYAKIKAKCNISSNGYALAFFDESKTLLPTISITGDGSSVSKTIDMEVPNEAAYCMLSDYQYSGSSDAYITLIPINGLLDRVDKLDARTNPLNGKTIAILGDSISSVAYTVPNYWQMIAENTGCRFLDYGVSGSCFSVRSGSTTSFVERASNMASADCVLVMGGTNDVGKDILLGEWSSSDNTTFYGALNALISLLRTKYPGKPIIFCTPIKRKYDKDSSFPYTMADLKSVSASTNLDMWHCVFAIKAKCAVHGIPVIDLYNDSGIGSGLSVYFRENDDLHPSELGECRIANMVQPVLEQQFLYTAEYTEEPVITYTNLVSTSTDTDGSVYNSVGYKDNARLSSSGSVSSSAQAGSVTTGFIPFAVSDIIRMRGAEWLDMSTAHSGHHYYLNFYDSSKTFIMAVTSQSYYTSFTSNFAIEYDESTGITTFDVIDGSTAATSSLKDVAYFRLNAYGSGADLIITVNQEITE